MAWQRSARVVYEVIDGRAVLIDPDGVELLTLNEVGTLVWQALDGHLESPELAAALVVRFDGVDQTDLERDIAAFLDELESAALVAPLDDAGG